MNEKAIRKRLRSLAGSGKKVQLTRGFPSDPRHNGFVIAAGDELVLIRKFHDFYSEGFSALRLRDITSIRSEEYERHWERMLAAEGILDRLQVLPDVPLDNVSHLLNALQRRGKNVVVECENADPDLDDFNIGQIISVDRDMLRIANFDGLGRWLPSLCTVPVGKITQVQIETPYVQTFSKYLEGPCPFGFSSRGDHNTTSQIGGTLH